MGLYLGDTNLIPTASDTEKGGVKVGEGLSMNGETLNIVPATSATYGGVKLIYNPQTLTLNIVTVEEK